MQANQNQTRVDIEAAIEASKEAIDDCKHKLRWLTRGVYVLCFSAIIAAVSFIIVNAVTPFNIPVLSSVLQLIGIGAVVVSILIGFGLGGYYNEGGSHISDWLKELREEKQLLKKLVHRLAYIDEQALRHITPEQYIHQLPAWIKAYRKQADSYRNRFIIFQFITILLFATITSLSGGWLDKYISLPWIIPVLGLLISILTSFYPLFQIQRERNEPTANSRRDGLGVYRLYVRN